MFWIILAILAIVTWIILFILNVVNELVGPIIGLLFIIISIGCMFSAVVGSCSYGKEPITITEIKTPIISTFNETNVEGSFFIGSGTVDDVEYIYTFAKSKNNEKGYIRLNIQMKNVIIIETDNVKPMYYVEIYKYKSFFCIWHYKNVNKRIVYIPTNTIVRQYNLR